MKKLLPVFLLLFCACVYSARQSDANRTVRQYIRELLDNPKYLEPVAFSPLEKHRYVTSLDTSLTVARIKSDEYDKMEKYVDSENYQRPDRVQGNIGQLDSIKHDKLLYYTIDYSFRVDSLGHKKLKKYHFELDTAFRVLKAVDITYGRDTRQEDDDDR